MTRKRIDENQPIIVDALRKCGASVAITSSLGDGFPDIIAGYRGVNLMMEIKDGYKPPSQRRLTPDEQTFHDEWRGQLVIVKSVEEALQCLQSIKK